MVTIARLRTAAAGSSYRQARCRLGDSMVQAVQHVMTSAAGSAGSAPNWWARGRDVANYPDSVPGEGNKD